MSSACFEPHYSTYYTAYTDACKTYHTIKCLDSRLPKDEPRVWNM